MNILSRLDRLLSNSILNRGYHHWHASARVTAAERMVASSRAARPIARLLERLDTIHIRLPKPRSERSDDPDTSNRQKQSEREVK